MEKKRINLGSVAAGASKTAVGVFGKVRDTVVKTVDQNGDGELNMQDVAAIAGTIGEAAKNTAIAAKDTAETRSRELELKMLQPIFVDDLDNADFLMPKLIRITEMDKRRAESEVCKGSIGYISNQKDLSVVNIYRDKADVFGLTFFPDMDSEIYYVDPSDRDHYIALDDYFGYLKVARVTELQKIAQDLGAKHFKVTFKEQKSTFSGKTAHAKLGIKALRQPSNADAALELVMRNASTVEIAAEMNCPGHAPQKPTLRYLQREPSIHSLISLRMDKTSPISHQKYTLKFSNSSGIKEKDAIRIDAALKAMKLTGNTTIASEAKNEARRFFEYEIDF